MNNPPAFPTGIITDGKGKIIGGSNGMTLRDYFAVKATDQDIEPHLYDCSEMVDGFYYSPTANDFIDTKYPKKRSREEAKYLYADAMLKVRQA